jgi:hypothetical protein
VAVQQKLAAHLLVGYPGLRIEFDTKDFLKGAPLDQMNFAVAGVGAGVMTANEARAYLGLPSIDGGDSLQAGGVAPDPIPGSSPQDTGGGGGNQKSRMNIGKT